MLDVSEITKYQVSLLNRLKISLFERLDPYLGKINKIATILSFENMIGHPTGRGIKKEERMSKPSMNNVSL